MALQADLASGVSDLFSAFASVAESITYKRIVPDITDYNAVTDAYAQTPTEKALSALVDTDRRKEQRQPAEDAQHHAQGLRAKELTDVLLEGDDGVDREARIDVPDRGTDRGRQSRGLARRAHDQIHRAGGALHLRYEDDRSTPIAVPCQQILPDIGYDSDHGAWRTVDNHALADRVLIWPVARREALVDDNDSGRVHAVLRAEVTAA